MPDEHHGDGRRCSSRLNFFEGLLLEAQKIERARIFSAHAVFVFVQEDDAQE